MSAMIRIVTPHTTPRPRKLAELAALESRIREVRFDHIGLDEGPASIESSYDEVLCAPGVVQRCLEAEAEGVHAVVIDCMGDPGIAAAREAVRIPVVGCCESTVHIAATLGHRFSVLTVLERVRPILERNIRAYGLADRLASVRFVNIGVLKLERDRPALLQALLEQSINAVREERVDTLVLGCTGFLGLSEELSLLLEKAGCAVPVLNPLRTAAATAIMLSALGLSQSARAYPTPDRLAKQSSEERGSGPAAHVTDAQA